MNNISGISEASLVRDFDIKTDPRLPRMILDHGASVSLIEDARKMFEDQDKPVCLTTGFQSLDEKLGGGLETGVYIFNGTPGVGKSSLMLQIADQCGERCLYITAELSAKALQMRRACRKFGDKSLKSYRNRDIPLEELERRYNSLSGLMHYVEGMWQPISIEDIEFFTMASNAKLVVLDSLHAWVRCSFSGGTEYDQLNKAMSQLVGLAERLHLPILLVSERNRWSGQEGGLSSCAGSRSIEFGAHSLICMNPSTGNGVCLKIEKSRASAVGECSLNFYGDYQAFSE